MFQVAQITCNPVRVALPAYSTKMSMRELGVRLDQLPDHHQMLGDPVRVLLAQRLELGAGDSVEVLRLH